MILYDTSLEGLEQDFGPKFLISFTITFAMFRMVNMGISNAF